MKILFICHGNICRSTMAESVMTHLVRQAHLEHLFEINSAATSREELGNDIHPGTKAKLREVGIPFERRQARQITQKDYEYYDMLIGMDARNIINMRRFYGDDPQNKFSLLLDHSDRPHDIADPWYTGNFDTTYADIKEGCEALIKKIGEQK